MNPTGFRADSERNRRASIAVPKRYVTPREPVVLHASVVTVGSRPLWITAARDRRSGLTAGCRKAIDGGGWA